jgi:hypothetical protein
LTGRPDQEGIRLGRGVQDVVRFELELERDCLIVRKTYLIR